MFQRRTWGKTGMPLLNRSYNWPSVCIISNFLSFLIFTYKLLLLFQVTGVCCPDSQTEKTSFGDEAVLENNEARSSSASKEKVSEKSPRKTACLLSDSQKQKIRNSQCIRSNVKRDSVEQSDDFIAKQLNWPFVKFDPQNVLLTQRFVWRYRRAVDLGINRIIGGSPINPHQFKFVVSVQKQRWIQYQINQFKKSE